MTSAERQNRSSVRRGFYGRFGKRCFDLLAGSIVFVLVTPLLLVIYAILRLTIGPPVIFRQARAGLAGKPFLNYKFRTMTDQVDACGRLLPDEQRITKAGWLVRSTSLDELPQIFNVLKGEVSLVGPRPLHVRYLPRYTAHQARRHEVMPGVTGWVQINGRNNLTWEEKFELDVWYVDHRSFLVDLRILALTFWKVIKREGISSEGYVAAPEFMGSKPQAKSSGRPWEHGSEFHLIEAPQSVDYIEPPWNRNGPYFGSGRDALRAVLLMGSISRGWKRLLVPSYYCQRVVRALLQTGISVCPYSSWYPGDDDGIRTVRATHGDVVLIVNHFGLGPEVSIEADHGATVAVIEDHTHDPWSTWAYNSKADYCIVSLRKTLPIPDGGVLWSPTNQKLPGPPCLTEEHLRAAGEKLRAMELKSLFLQGKLDSKSDSRNLAASGEEHLCGTEISAMSEWSARHVPACPVKEWRDTRKKNHQAFAEALSGASWARVLFPRASSGSAPFCAVVLFDTRERREFVRQRLIEANIYPAILWSLERPAIDGISEGNIAASRKMLSIHCDMRYTSGEMVAVADSLRSLGDRFSL